MKKSKIVLILGLAIFTQVQNNALAPNIYLAEIDNQTNSKFYIATSTLYLNDFQPTGPESIQNNIDDPSKTYKYEYMILDEEAKNAQKARFINGKGTYVMDTQVQNILFSGNNATQPTKNDWQTALELTDNTNSSPEAYTKTIFLVPVPQPGSTYNDTCDPILMVGINDFYDPSITARGYLIAKTVGATNCCQIGGSTCPNDSLVGPPATLSSFPAGSVDKPTKLKLTIGPNWSLKLEII